MNADLFKSYIKHTPEEIRGFFGEYRFLSNFHPCTIIYDGIVYDNSEAAYQAAKTHDKAEKEMFRLMTGREAKEAGRKVTLRKDWEQVKDMIMFDVLTYKFLSDDELMNGLGNTRDAYLEETNWWGDTYWGKAVNAEKMARLKPMGQNQLGKILMMVRTILP